MRLGGEGCFVAADDSRLASYISDMRLVRLEDMLWQDATGIAESNRHGRRGQA